MAEIENRKIAKSIVHCKNICTYKHNEEQQRSTKTHRFSSPSLFYNRPDTHSLHIFLIPNYSD